MCTLNDGGSENDVAEDLWTLKSYNFLEKIVSRSEVMFHIYVFFFFLVKCNIGYNHPVT